jgi:hypothetical protein
MQEDLCPSISPIAIFDGFRRPLRRLGEAAGVVKAL